MQKGFALIETIIYIALFSILMTSGFVATYQIISSADLLNQKNRTEEEGNFVLRKMSWSFAGLDAGIIPTVSGSGCSQSISISKTNTANPIRIRTNVTAGVNYLEIQDDGVTYYPLTTINASTSCLKFSIISGNPYGIIATTTINGKDFVIKKYARL
ncbi:MAG: prepilin-type N-terminal cleavage/methylation domain-containing protein [Minisyncoccia bacterium]